MADIKRLSLRQSLILRPDAREAEALRAVAGRDASKALLNGGCSVAPCFSLRQMGHKRPRPKRLAEKLLQIRKVLGLSQLEMAKRMGKSYNVVSKYERDQSVPTLGEILAYARAVNVHMEQIVDDDLELNL